MLIIRSIYYRLGRVKKLIGNINYLRAYIWKVKLGKGAEFYGKTYFFKAGNSQIIIGKNCIFNSSVGSNWIGIDRPCMISTRMRGGRLIIGDNCGFSGTVIGAHKLIKLGDNVRCGANTLITDADWHLDDPRASEPADIIIENNVWLGVNCVVMKGVTIGENSVIGANSLVTKDIPANVVAAGNPCKVIKPIKQAP